MKIATIDNVHNVLHQVFQVAVDDGMIRQNPTDNMLKELKLSHGFEREKKEALTVAQQKLFFDYSVKAHICQSNRLGYYLIKRTTDTSQMAAEIKTLFIRNHIYLHTDSEKDVQVLRERFLEWKNRNACKLNGKY